MSLLTLVFGSIRIAWLRRNGISVGERCRIHSTCRVGHGPFSKIHGTIEIYNDFHADVGVIVYTYGGSIKIYDGVYIGPYSVIYGHGDVSIGANTIIAMSCHIVSSNHAIPGRATLIRSHSDILRSTYIGDDCWLGAGVNVLAGVRIGDGCVIGAGSIVTRDLPAYSIAVGNPARVIRFRDAADLKPEN